MTSSTKIRIFTLCLLISSVLCDDTKTGNANAIIDEILENLSRIPSIAARLEPLQAPDVETDKYSAWNITINGISKLRRHGDATFRFDPETAIGNLMVTLQVKNVTFSLHYKAKTVLSWIQGVMDGVVDYVTAKMVLTVNERRLSLKSFNIIDLGDYKIKKATGLGFLLNWGLKMRVNGIARRSKERIVAALEREATSALRKLVPNIESPL